MLVAAAQRLHTVTRIQIVGSSPPSPSVGETNILIGFLLSTVEKSLFAVFGAAIESL